MANVDILDALTRAKEAGYSGAEAMEKATALMGLRSQAVLGLAKDGLAALGQQAFSSSNTRALGNLYELAAQE